MLCSRVWLGQAFDRASTVDALPKDAEVSLAIRLKGNALTVSRPDGEAILAAKSELAHRIRARELVDPNVRVIPIIYSDNHSLPIRRDAWKLIGSRAKLQRFDSSVSVNEDENALAERC
jgi:hypothetical protein